MPSKLHIVAITALIKNPSKDKFLVAKRNAHEIAYPGKWTFPGGKAERGETVLATLQREILEEVGLEIQDDARYLKDFTFIRPDDQNVIGFCFAVVAKSENVKISDAFDEFRWVTPQEFQSLDSIPGMEEEVRLAFQL